MRGLHFNKRVQIVEHGAVDQHRRFEARSAEHDTMAGSDDFRTRKMGFQPTDDVFQRCCVVDRMALAPFMRVQRLARCVLDDKVRISLHAVDAARAKQRQRRRRVGGQIHPVSAELQTGRAGIEDDDGLLHRWRPRNVCREQACSG